MSQRKSGYERKALDLYQTPAWVTEALIPHLPRLPDRVWEPAAGDGKMVQVLREHFDDVLATDISKGQDFLKAVPSPDIDFGGIISNPPFNIAYDFIKHAIHMTYPCQGFVAMLLRVDYDSAKTRSDLFGGSAIFHKKVVLTKRITWIERADGIKAAPSYNHCWQIWDWQNSGPPTIAYAD